MMVVVVMMVIMMVMTSGGHDNNHHGEHAHNDYGDHDGDRDVIMMIIQMISVQ